MSEWTLLAVQGAWEYWQSGEDVYRRRVSDFNYLSAVDGSPVGARWECSRAHYDRFLAAS